MARATHDFNSEGCGCGQDHNALDYIVAALLQAGEAGEIQFENEWGIGQAVADHAKAVGWVRAGDELEDLRQLTMGMTGLDQVEDATPSVIHKTLDVSKATTMGLAYAEGKLYVGAFDGDPVATDPDIRYVIDLDKESRNRLAAMLLDDSQAGTDEIVGESE